MKTTVVDPEFGVPVDVLRNKDEIFGLPQEVAVRRAERGELHHPEPPEPPEIPGQAREALKAEANGTGLSFEWDGETYLIPNMDDWDLDVFEAEEAGQPWKVVRLLLGPAQYERFKTEPDPDKPGQRRKKKRTMRDVSGWMTAATKAAGVEPGE